MYSIQNAQPAWLKRHSSLGKFPSYRATELWSLFWCSLMDYVLHNRLKSSQQKGGSISTPSSSSLSSSSSCSRQTVNPVKHIKQRVTPSPAPAEWKSLWHVPHMSHSAALGEALKWKKPSWLLLSHLEGRGQTKIPALLKGVHDCSVWRQGLDPARCPLGYNLLLSVCTQLPHRCAFGSLSAIPFSHAGGRPSGFNTGFCSLLRSTHLEISHSSS